MLDAVLFQYSLVQILEWDEDILEKLNEGFKSNEWPELNKAIKTIESQDGRYNELKNLKSFFIMNPQPVCCFDQYIRIFYNPSDSSLPPRFSADEIKALDMKFYNSELWKETMEIDNPLLPIVNQINYVHKLIKDGTYTKKEIEDKIKSKVTEDNKHLAALGAQSEKIKEAFMRHTLAVY